MIFKSSAFLFLILLFVAAATAQSTFFNYQGSLNDGGQPANGSFDFEFALYSSASGGTELNTFQANNVTVTDGRFSVPINFGLQFNGNARFLEVRVRNAGGTSYTTLGPRTPFLSAPYAIRSLGAAIAADSLRLGDVAADQYVVTTDPRLSDNRTPTANSPFYIRNGTSQQLANFNINAKGSAEIFNFRSLIEFNGETAIQIGSATDNEFVSFGLEAGTGDEGVFIGRSAGRLNTGARNTFIGHSAGTLNSSGFNNTFVGSRAGLLNITGNQNTFIGTSAGTSNNASNNTFLGFNSGIGNTTGFRQAFFGSSAGTQNTTGNENAFFGNQSGFFNTTGSRNSFFGQNSGATNTTGHNITLIGHDSDVGSEDLTFATAIGSNAVVTSSNTVQLGRDGSDRVRIGLLGTGGSTSLCLNNVNAISTCSSSIRYKSNVEEFTNGLNIVRKLRPVTFTWNAGGTPDVGFVAEEVADIEPLLTTSTEGQVEGVKYDRITVALVNAVNEQQTIVEKQKKLIEEQDARLRELQKQVDALKSLVCVQKPKAEVCAKGDQ